MRRHGHAMPRKLKLGAMIEVPSLLWQLDELLPEVADFVSVGSNDLIQFMTASDRGNARRQRFDPLSPAVPAGAAAYRRRGCGA